MVLHHADGSFVRMGSALRAGAAPRADENTNKR